MIRLSVSHLDSWVRFVEPAMPQFEISTEQFLAQMRKQTPPSLAMKAGSGLHELLEHAEPGDQWGSLEGVPRGGFIYRFDVDAELELPVVREPEVIEKVFHTSVGPVALRGRIDGRDRIRRVIDYKLTEKFDAERYGSSLQWPSYLLMTGAQRFRYIIFQVRIKEPKKKDEPVNVYIHTIHDFDQWAYPEMEQDVHRRVEELAEFVSRTMPGELEDGRAAPDETQDDDE